MAGRDRQSATKVVACRTRAPRNLVLPLSHFSTALRIAPRTSRRIVSSASPESHIEPRASCLPGRRRAASTTSAASYSKAVVIGLALGSGRLAALRRRRRPSLSCSAGVAAASPPGRLLGSAIRANAVVLARPSIRHGLQTFRPLPERTEGVAQSGEVVTEDQMGSTPIVWGGDLWRLGRHIRDQIAIGPDRRDRRPEAIVTRSQQIQVSPASQDSLDEEQPRGLAPPYFGSSCRGTVAVRASYDVTHRGSTLPLCGEAERRITAPSRPTRQCRHRRAARSQCLAKQPRGLDGGSWLFLGGRASGRWRLVGCRQREKQALVPVGHGTQKDRERCRLGGRFVRSL